MKSPFPFIPSELEPRVFWIALAASVVLLGAMKAIGHGQVARTVEGIRGQAELEALLEKWGASGQQRAVLYMCVDFLLIPAYVLAIGLGCAITARSFGAGAWSAVGFGLAAGIYLGGAADVVENVLVLHMIRSGAFSEPLMAAARIATAAKWIFGGAGFLYSLSFFATLFR